MVENFLLALGNKNVSRDPLFYLNIIQKMRGEWYNQEGKSLNWKHPSFSLVMVTRGLPGVTGGVTISVILQGLLVAQAAVTER